MLLSHRLIIALFGLCLHLSVHGETPAWQVLPGGFNSQSVADEMRLNGVPMKIISVNSKLPLEKALAEVKRSWSLQPGAANIERTTLGQWQVLNQRYGEQHRSLQLREAGNDSVEGYLALSSPAQTREPKPAIRLPSDVQTVSITESQDGSKQAQQIVAVSPRSVDAIASAIESSLRAEGWKKQVNRKESGVIYFSADRNKDKLTQEFDARVMPQKNGTLIFMNTLLHPN